MNIVLVHGYIKSKQAETYMSEPLGLICLASYVDAVFGADVSTSILDLYADGALEPKLLDDGLSCYGISDPTYIKNELKKLQPDLIGIHCNFTAFADDSLELATLIKSLFPDVPILIGGAHPTIEGNAVMHKCPAIDFTAIGEGEIILEHLIRHLRGETAIEEVPGLLYRKDGEIIATKPAQLIKDLDDLPIPSRRYIDLEKYSYFNKKTVWYAKQAPIATIMTSRGCPYDCVFCSTKVVWTRKWRFRSLENVFKEILMLVQEYGIKEIIINDDQFMTRKKRIHDFCDFFIEKNLGITFAVDSGISVWLTDNELLKKMKMAGFYSLRFPIESGSKKTLEYVKKPIDLDKAKKIINDANEMGFWTSSNIIVGFPYETREDIIESIKYAYDSTLDFTSFIIAKPHAGSEMYETFKNDGLLETKVIRGSDFYSADYDTHFLTATELQDIVNKASSGWFPHKIKHYINPRYFYRYFLPKIKTLSDIRYFISIIFVVYKQKIRPIIAAKLCRIRDINKSSVLDH